MTVINICYFIHFPCPLFYGVMNLWLSPKWLILVPIYFTTSDQGPYVNSKKCTMKRIGCHLGRILCWLTHFCGLLSGWWVLWPVGVRSMTSSVIDGKCKCQICLARKGLAACDCALNELWRSREEQRGTEGKGPGYQVTHTWTDGPTEKEEECRRDDKPHIQ